jgi:glycosyltransferase involved in cell wall biosynthesis
MKITILQGAFFPVPPKLGGAVEKLWYALGREFARRGHEVVHVSRQWGELAVQERVDGVLHIRVKGFDASVPSWRFRLADLIYSWRALRVLPKADIVVTNTFFSPLLLNPKKHGHVYVSVHRFPRRQHKWYRTAVRFQCVSSAVAAALIEQSPECTSKTKVIPNFVSRVVDAQEVEDGWKERANVMLFVGRVHPEKGVDVLLRAFARLPPALQSSWRLVIVGPHEETLGGAGNAYMEDLKSTAQRLNIAVEWVGSVFDAQRLNKLYASARLFAYPSLASQGEAFGLAPLEAMAQGTPVVVSQLHCFRDFVEQGRNGWTFNHAAASPETELGDALQKAISELSSRHNQFYNAALETAQRFTLEQVAGQFIEDFEALTANDL